MKRLPVVPLVSLAALLAMPALGAEGTRPAPELSRPSTIMGNWDTATTGPNSPLVNPFSYIRVDSCKSRLGQGRAYCVSGVRRTGTREGETSHYFGEIVRASKVRPGGAEYVATFTDSHRPHGLRLQGDTITINFCTEPEFACQNQTWTRRTRP